MRLEAAAGSMGRTQANTIFPELVVALLVSATSDG